MKNKTKNTDTDQRRLRNHDKKKCNVVFQISGTQHGNWQENSRALDKICSSVNGNTTLFVSSLTLVHTVVFGGYFDNKMKMCL